MADTMTWDHHAGAWDTNPAVRTFADAAFGSLKALFADLHRALDKTRVLDFGCGTGLLSERLIPHSAEIVALDASRGMIEALQNKVSDRQLACIHPVHGVLTASLHDSQPRLQRPFDLIVCSSVCAFLDDYPGTVQMLARMLAPGGIFVQWDWAYNPDDDEPFGLTTDAIDHALSAAGLRIVRVSVGFERTHEGMTMAPLMGVGQRRG